MFMVCFACWSEIDYKGNRASAISKLLLLLEHVKGLWLVKSRLLTVPLLIVERAREIAVRNFPRSNLAVPSIAPACSQLFRAPSRPSRKGLLAV